MEIFKFFVTIPKPFNFKLTVRKPAGWFWGTQFEIFEENILYTALRLSGGRLVGLKLLAEKDRRVQVWAYTAFKVSASDKMTLIKRVEIGLGVDNNLKGFYSLAKSDPLIKKLKNDLYGLRTGFATDIFERAILAITLQMTPQKRSMEMRDCLIKKYGDKIGFDHKTIFYWPSAETISKAPIEELRNRCKLGYRAKAIVKTAQAIASSAFPDIVKLNSLNESEINKCLKSLYGIGDYSTQIISPSRGFPLDIWSARIFSELLKGQTPKNPRKAIKELEEEATKRWGEYKQYVFVYVLNDLPALAKEYNISKLS